MSPVEIPALLLGVRLDATDPIARVFLLFTVVLWAAATPIARAQLGPGATRRPFWVWWAGAFVGMAGVAMSGDLVGFYALYALLTYAIYGLVAHDRSGAAMSAGRVYVTMAIVGEMLLLWALLLISVEDGTNLAIARVPAVVAASENRDAIVGLLLAGFGVKSALFPLHVWAPLAYSAAPAAAGAVIGGATLHAGLLAWLRLLPLGEVALPGWGALCASVGLFAVFYAVIVGVGQREPRAVLTYSSVGQIGFVATCLGAALAAPTVAAEAEAALLTFALHHALAKGLLFLGIVVAAAAGGRSRGWVAAGLVWVALELAGAPMTSGSVAKGALEHVVEAAPWGEVAAGLLTLGTAGSALLAIRFLWLVWPRGAGAAPSPRVWAPWALLIGFDAATLLWAPAPVETLAWPGPAKLWHGLWPILFAGAIAVGAREAGRRGHRWPQIPPGDLLALLVPTRTLRALYRRALGAGHRGREASRGAIRAATERAAAAAAALVEGAEAALRERRAIGVAMAGVFFVLLAALATGFLG